jgi:hypothetical protein
MKSLRFSLSFILIFSSLNLSVAHAAPKPKCTGATLASYNKNAKLEAKQWVVVLESIESDEEYRRVVGRYPDVFLETLAKSNWRYYGYALEKYAKKCKVPMPKRWVDDQSDLPDM